MPQVLEDAQGDAQRLPRLHRVLRAELDVAQVTQGLSLGVAVAEFPREADGALVAAGGLGQVAEVLLGEAQAVPGSRLAGTVPEQAEPGHGRPAGVPGLPVVADQGVTPADVVQGRGLPGLVAGGQEQRESLLGVPERVGVPVLLLGHPAEGLVHLALAHLAAELPVQLEALGQVVNGLLEPPARAQVCATRRRAVACAARSPVRIAASSPAR
jgi:hypothetical protein